MTHNQLKQDPFCQGAEKELTLASRNEALKTIISDFLKECPDTVKAMTWLMTEWTGSKEYEYINSIQRANVVFEVSKVVNFVVTLQDAMKGGNDE